MNIVLELGIIKAKPVIEKIKSKSGKELQRIKFKLIQKDNLLAKTIELRCVAFGNFGINLANRLDNGSLIAIQGELVIDIDENIIVRVCKYQILDATTRFAKIDYNDLLRIYKPNKVYEDTEQILKESTKNES